MKKTYISILILLILSCSSDVCTNNSSALTNIECSEKNIEDLFILCKIWGIVKFHHPDVIKGSIDWDSELFKLLPSILKSSSTTKRNRILLEWLKELPAVTPENKTSEIPNVQQVANFEWLENLKLGKISDRLKKLVCVSQDIYPTRDSIILVDQMIQYDKGYPDLPTLPDAKFRLLTLFRYWNIVEYFFPHKHLMDKSWDKILLQFIPEFIKVNSAPEYRMLIVRLISSIHDGHATIIDPLTNSLLGTNIIPVKLDYIQDRIIVIKANTENTLKPGDILLAINGKSVDSIINQKRSLTPASNERAKLHTIAKNILRSNDSVLAVTYNRDGQILCNSIKTDNIKTSHLKNDNISFQTYFNHQVYYFNLTSDIPTHIPMSIDAKGIIIDLRGSLNFESDLDFEFLYSKPIQFAKFAVPFLPGVFVYQNHIQTTVTSSNSGKYFTGKTIIIINSETQSSSEFMAMCYGCAADAVIIGSQSAGANGDILTITLPGNIKTTISGLGVYYPNGLKTQRIGIKPDIYIYPTISNVRKNQDVLLDSALCIIKKNIEDSENRKE